MTETPFDHGDLTRPPEQVGASCPPQPALPLLVDPPHLPPLERDCGEPLVTVDHPRAVHLRAYRRAGFAESPNACLLRASVAERLYRAVSLLPEPFGLAIFDCWRPARLQRRLARIVGDSRYVAEADDPRSGPAPHTTGGAVDLTLSFGDVPLSLGTHFDEFVPAAATTAFEDHPGPVRELRRLLYWTLVRSGFAAYQHEWWHFEYGTRRWAAITSNPPLYGETKPFDRPPA